MKKPSRKPGDAPQNIIYGLVDPRIDAIRYIGLSTRGLARPKEHRKKSSSATYCGRWIRALQRLGLTYKINVLEVVDTEEALAGAERKWIARGRSKHWPLTNLTSGGGLSAEAIETKRERKRSQVAATVKELRRANAHIIDERLQHLNNYFGIPAEIRRRCFVLFNLIHLRSVRVREFDLIRTVATQAPASLDTTAKLYDAWKQDRAREDQRALEQLKRRPHYAKIPKLPEYAVPCLTCVCGHTVLFMDEEELSVAVTRLNDHIREMTG